MINKSENINTSNNIRTENYSSRGYRRPNTKQKINPNKSKLKVGEIVYGEILKKLDDEVFKINMPNGIFSSVIHPNLRQGDKLYFKVIKVKPNLEIIVHSTDLYIEDNRILFEEMIRVLQLENNSITKELILEYSKRANRLFRSVLGDAYLLYNNSASNFEVEKYTSSLAHIIFELYFSGFDLKSENISKLFDNYIEPDYIQKLNLDFDILPNNNRIEQDNSFISKYEKILFIRNTIAELNNSQKIYYLKADEILIRMEYFSISNKIKFVLIELNKQTKFFLNIDEYNKFISISSNSIDNNRLKNVKNIFDNYKIKIIDTNLNFIPSSAEHFDEAHKKLTFVV